MNFSEDECKMLQTYWNPAFNNSWIYLSPKPITEDMGYDKVDNFYHHVLRKHYQEDTEYKEVSEDDEIVKSYEIFAPNQSGANKKSNRGGHNKKYYIITLLHYYIITLLHYYIITLLHYYIITLLHYYIITGKTLKKMLMRSETEKGRKTRDYYIKVEELAIFMYRYIQALHKYIFNKEKKELEQKLEEEKAKTFPFLD